MITAEEAIVAYTKKRDAFDDLLRAVGGWCSADIARLAKGFD